MPCIQNKLAYKVSSILSYLLVLQMTLTCILQHSKTQSLFKKRILVKLIKCLLLLDYLYTTDLVNLQLNTALFTDLYVICICIDMYMYIYIIYIYTYIYYYMSMIVIHYSAQHI